MKQLLFLLALLPAVAHGQSPPQPGFFVDMQNLWFDSVVNDDFEYAPRFAVGYDDAVGFRARYWTFGQHGRNGDSDVGPFHNDYLNLDVTDLEATTHLRYEGSDFMLSGGARIARIGYGREPVTSPADLSAKNATFGGVTLGAEGRTKLLGRETWAASFVYGGRYSLLKGDWEGHLNFSSNRQQNARFTVPEIYTGLELAYGQAFTRFTVEFQDWGTVAPAPAIEQYGFTGYGFDLGWTF